MQSWERWRRIDVCDVRIILVEEIFAIPASRGLCFLCVIVARLKNERIFSASVAWNQIQAANRDQRKYAQKRNKHPLVFRGVKPKWLSAKPCSVLCQKEFFNNECRFFKSLCVKPTIYGSTTTYHREWVDLTQYNFSNDPLNAFRWYRSRTVLPKLCSSGYAVKSSPNSAEVRSNQMLQERGIR